MSDWKPIESAPRDGEFYLGYDAKRRRFLVVNEPPYCARGEWGRRGRAWCGQSTFGADDLTHWMPLPDPPEGE